MKIKLLIICCTLLLMGCSNENLADQKTVTQTPTENNASIAIENYSLADQAAFQASLDTKDISFCDRIENIGLKEQCKTDVNDQINYDKAVRAHDASLCKNLNNADKQKACEIDIEAYHKQLESQKAADEKNKLMYEELSRFVNEGNIEQCKTLLEENLVKSCEYTIAATEAVNKKDPNICSKITDEQTEKECMDMVKAGMN